MGEYFFETKNPGIFGIRILGGFGFLRGKGGVANHKSQATSHEYGARMSDDVHIISGVKGSFSLYVEYRYRKIQVAGELTGQDFHEGYGSEFYPALE